MAETKETYTLDVYCENCKTTFPREMEKGEMFAKSKSGTNKFIVCPTCGVWEDSRHTYPGDPYTFDNSYTFKNFQNRGLHVEKEVKGG